MAGAAKRQRHACLARHHFVASAAGRGGKAGCVLCCGSGSVAGRSSQGAQVGDSCAVVEEVGGASRQPRCRMQVRARWWLRGAGVRMLVTTHRQTPPCMRVCACMHACTRARAGAAGRVPCREEEGFRGACSPPLSPSCNAANRAVQLYPFMTAQPGWFALLLYGSPPSWQVDGQGGQPISDMSPLQARAWNFDSAGVR